VDLIRRRTPPLLAGPALVLQFALATGDPTADPAVQSLFDAVPLAQFVLDENRGIRIANAEAHRLFVGPAEQLRGRTFDSLFSAAARPSIGTLFASLRSGPSPTQRITTEGSGPQGVGIPVEVVAFRLPTSARSPYGVTVRPLADSSPARPKPSAPPNRPYSLPELLLANRLKEMV
jgi:hypothetical protein